MLALTVALIVYRSRAVGSCEPGPVGSASRTMAANEATVSRPKPLSSSSWAPRRASRRIFVRQLRPYFSMWGSVEQTIDERGDCGRVA
jgi:hypothetical protein